MFDKRTGLEKHLDELIDLIAQTGKKVDTLTEKVILLEKIEKEHYNNYLKHIYPQN